MNSIELTQERNTLWAASQFCLKATDTSRATQTALARGLIVAGSYNVGLHTYAAYVLTCAGERRLNELDRKG